MTAYREASEIRKQWSEHIIRAAELACQTMEMELSPPNIEQAIILMTALKLFEERNAITPDAWKSAGYLGNLLALKGKVNRMMASLWYKVAPNGNIEKPIDNALDAINYAAFFARLYETGDERGTPWD